MGFIDYKNGIACKEIKIPKTTTMTLALIFVHLIHLL